MRYGGVPYLNARPLLEGLAPLGLDVPSRLSARFLAGEFDAALLPVAAGALSGRPRIGSLGIASFGRVDSVLLFLRRPLRAVRTLRLDPSSRTSRLLAQLVLRRLHGLQPEIVPGEADAELIIGDAALRRAGDALERLDLGEEWRRMTGLPFVFAAWYGDAGAVPALEEAYARGSRRIDDYAIEASGALGLPPATLRSYLTDRIRYRLGSAEEAGLDRFLEESRGAGLL